MRYLRHFIIVFGITVFFSNTSRAQITINNLTTLTTPQTANALVDSIIGGGVTYSGASFMGVRIGGNGYQCGYFTTASTTQAQMGFSRGIVLSTGNTASIPLALGTHPGSVAQMSKAYTSCTAGEVRQGGTCATVSNDLDILAGSVSFYNAAILEFDFVPVSDSVEFRYVFGSEEYTDNTGSINYQCSDYNDKFGFLISGPGIAGGAGYTNNARNIARLSNGSEVGINSVNNGVVGSSGGAPSAATCLSCNPAWIQNTPTPEYNGIIDGTGLNGNTDVLVAAQGGLTPGATYHIKLMVLDANDAAYDAVVYIEAGSFVSPVPTSTLEATPSTICDGGSTWLVADVSNGTAPYTFTWSTGDVHNSSNPVDSLQVSPAASSSYTVTVTDNTAPTPLNQVLTVNIAVDSPVLSAAGQTNVLCFGLSTGAASVSVTGGTGPYSFTWSHNAGLNSSSASGLASGVYTVTVSDQLSCPDTYTFTITQPENALAATFVPGSVTNVSCYGGSTGSATVTPSGGSGSVNYAWSHNGSLNSPSASGLSNGTYTVTVTDAHLCTATATATVSQPLQGLSASIPPASIEVVDCYGESTGSLQVTVVGGTTAYSYSWSHNGSLNNATATGLSAGNYTVTVTDANLCTATVSATVTQPAAALSAVILPGSVTQVLCYNENTGAATVTPSGGTGSYTYTWSHNPGLNAPTASSLAAGTFSVTVSDANGCTTAANITISEPAAALAALPSVVSSSCGNPDGSVSFSVSGGTSPYQYTWLNYTDSISSSMQNLPAGAYHVTVTDQNGCTLSASATISDLGGPVVSLDTAVNILCHGLNTGEIQTEISGGTGTLTLLWSNGHTDPAINGLTAGTYTLSVTDINNCLATLSYEITEPDTLVAGLSPVPVSCNGLSDGAIFLTPMGGNAGYQYAWSSGNSSQNITDIPSGWYNVTVTDQNNCIFTDSIEVVQPDTLVVTQSLTDVTCAGDTDGNANITVSGGVATYSFAWSSGQVTEDIASLSGGAYYFTVTDANNCIYSDSLVIAEALPLETVLLVTNVSCNGRSDGAVDLTVSGGNGGNEYQWTGGLLTEDISNLSGGTYMVTVTDQNGCSNTDTVVVNEADSLLLSMAVSHAGCYGNSDGTVSLTITGGNGSNAFVWSGGQSTEDLSGIPAGTYTITVTDANGCTAEQTATVQQPGQIVVAVTINSVSCNGMSDGSVMASVSGGTPGYTYDWSHDSGLNTNTADQLVAGSYVVMVTDSNNCTTLYTADVTEPAPMNTVLDVMDVLCYGSSTGSVSTTVSGGTPPYLYSWNGITGASAISNVPAGIFAVTVTDTHGCSDVQETEIIQPEAIVISGEVTDATCPDSRDGTLNVTVAGGNLPYTYNWSVNSTADNLQEIQAGSYTLTVTDANGCSTDSLFLVGSASDYCLKIPTVFTPNGDGVNESWEIEHIELYEEITIEIFNRWGDRIFVYSGTGSGYADAANRWNGIYNGKDLPMAPYVFILDLKNGGDPVQGVVTLIR
jgi:gliding motility-associated-like protein